MTGLRLRVLVNVVLLLLIAGLAIFIWLDPWGPPPPAEEKLSAIDPTRVVRVRIQGPKREPIELRRESAVWRLVVPLSLPANEHRVAALLGLAAARVHDGFRAQGNDLKQFGLEPPTARVLLNDDEFLFGDTESLNGWRYVLYGTDVHLITDAYYHHLLATPAAFVDPAPIGVDARPVAFILSGATLRLENGSWQIEPPEAGLGADSGNRLAQAWKSARAASVKRFDPSLGWSETIQVELNGETAPLRFQVARLEHELVIGRPQWNVQYHFPKRAGLRLVELGD